MKMKDFSWDSKGHRDLEKMIDELFLKPPSSNSLTKSPKRRWYHFFCCLENRGSYENENA